MANPPLTLFGAAQRAMSAQLVRMNAAASNLANAGTVTGNAETAYRPIRTVFAAEVDRASADANGNIWTAPVDENAEMVEMLDASRQYQNLVEALSTAKQLMLETMRMK